MLIQSTRCIQTNLTELSVLAFSILKHPTCLPVTIVFSRDLLCNICVRCNDAMCYVSNEGNQRHSALSSLLRLMVVQALLLALPADFQRYPNYDVPYITSGIDRLYNPMYSAPPPPPPSVPYGSTTYYGSSIYGVQATQRPVYPQNYSPATPSNCLSYYCYRSALPSLDVITNATAPAVEPVCGKRNYLICAADKPVSTEYSAPSSPYQYQQYQKSNVCPAYFCKLVPRTTPVLVAADSCDSFECNIIE